MQILIFVHDVKMCASYTIELDVEASDTIYNVKTKIHDQEGIPPNQQLFRRIEGREPEDEDKLVDLGIQQSSTMYIGRFWAKSLA